GDFVDLFLQKLENKRERKREKLKVFHSKHFVHFVLLFPLYPCEGESNSEKRRLNMLCCSFKLTKELKISYIFKQKSPSKTYRVSPKRFHQVTAKHNHFSTQS
ncbi:hypothetical protein PanWU01x14_182190, partial [Parasponia andersonii]